MWNDEKEGTFFLVFSSFLPPSDDYALCFVPFIRKKSHEKLIFLFLIFLFFLPARKTKKKILPCKRKKKSLFFDVKMNVKCDMKIS